MVGTINKNAETHATNNGWVNELAVIRKEGWDCNLSGGLYKLTTEKASYQGDNLPRLIELAKGGGEPTTRSRRVLSATDAPAPKEIEGDAGDIELDNTGKRERKVREVKAPRAKLANRYERTATAILANLSIGPAELADSVDPQLQYAAGVYCIEAFQGVTTALIKAGIIPTDSVAAVTYTKPVKGKAQPQADASPAPEATPEVQPEPETVTEVAPEAEATSDVQPETVEQPEVTPEAETQPEPAKPMTKADRRRARAAARAAEAVAAASQASDSTTEEPAPEGEADTSTPQE